VPSLSLTFLKFQSPPSFPLLVCSETSANGRFARTYSNLFWNIKWLKVCNFLLFWYWSSSAGCNLYY
jgi:hypothetical protein